MATENIQITHLHQFSFMSYLLSLEYMYELINNVKNKSNRLCMKTNKNSTITVLLLCNFYSDFVFEVDDSQF